MLYLTNKNEPDLTSFSRFDVNDWEQIKQHITYRTMNKKVFDVQKNKENIVHEDVMDLSIVCIVNELSQDRKSVLSYTLTKEDLEKFGKTEEEVLEIAKDNIAKDTNKRIHTFKQDVIAKEVMYPLMRFPNGAMMGGANALIEDSADDKDNVIIVTNKYNVYGASYMFDYNTLDEVYKRMKDSFYILPLSIHQLMCVSSKYVTKDKNMFEAEDDLLDMLYEINSNNKKEEDILTYRMYYYAADDGCTLISIKQKL